jgi:hypothetical protein
MKAYITSPYVFTPGGSGAGTLLINQPDFDVKRLVAVINVTRNVVICAPGLSGAGIASVSNNIVTLEYDTSLQNASDTLQVIYDAGAGQSDNLLSRILQMLLAPLGYDKSSQRYRQTAIIESGTVTTVTTVTTLTNLSTIDTLQGRILVRGVNDSAWANCVRSRIT